MRDTDPTRLSLQSVNRAAVQYRALATVTERLCWTASDDARCDYAKTKPVSAWTDPSATSSQKERDWAHGSESAALPSGSTESALQSCPGL